MNLETKLKFEELKEKAFKVPSFKTAYTHMTNKLVDGQDIFEGLIDLEFPPYLIILIGDLLIQEDQEDILKNTSLKDLEN
jgi:hypothetical protein